MNEAMNINTDEIESIMKSIDKNISKTSGEIASSLSSSFNVLNTLSLFPGGISKIKKQLDSLNISMNNLIAKIGYHTTELVAIEQSIVTQTNSYKGGPSRNVSSGQYFETMSTYVDTLNDGKSVKEGSLSDQMILSLAGLSESELKNILEFIKLNASDATAIFNDKSKATELVKLSLQALNQDKNIDLKSIEDPTEIQKALLTLLEINGINIKGDSSSTNAQKVMLSQKIADSGSANTQIDIPENTLNMDEQVNI